MRIFKTRIGSVPISRASTPRARQRRDGDDWGRKNNERQRSVSGAACVGGSEVHREVACYIRCAIYQTACCIQAEPPRQARGSVASGVVGGCDLVAECRAKRAACTRRARDRRGGGVGEPQRAAGGV